MKLVNSLLFGVEVVFVLLPITAMLFLLGLPIAAEQVFNVPGLDNVVIALITFLAVMATISVWFVFIQSIRNLVVTNKINMVWWALIIVGFIISIAAVIVPRIASVEPYSEDWWFYDQLGNFALGAPLVLPVIHALVMGLLRNGVQKKN